MQLNSVMKHCQLLKCGASRTCGRPFCSVSLICTSSDAHVSAMQEPLPGPNAFKYGGRTVSAYPRCGTALCTSRNVTSSPLAHHKQQRTVGEVELSSVDTAARPQADKV